MTIRPTPRPPLHPLFALVVAFLAVGPPLDFGLARADDAPPDSLAAVAPVGSSIIGSVLEPGLRQLGLENLWVARTREGMLQVGFENRRYRHTDDALGRIARAVRYSDARVPFIAYESRLGLPAAAIFDTGAAPPVVLRYPTDPALPPPAPGPRLADTRRTVDLLIRPLFTFELGRLFDPALFRVDVEPSLRYQPWPGARLVASLTIPLSNEFEADALHPDLNRVRPGPTTIEQYAWVPGTVLLSGTAGLFADNRYGLSFGAARPFRSGEVLLDAQADLTGFIAFNETETELSDPKHWTGFAGVTWRPPVLDLAVSARAAHFLYGDHGTELALTRSMGDLDVGFFLQRAAGLKVTGVRIVVPIPPLERPVGARLRVLPTERFPLEYRDEAQPVGRSLQGVASREEFLRQLNRPSLAANAGRYAGAGGSRASEPGAATPPLERISFTGTSGFILTPWAGTLADQGMEAGFNTLPKAVAYDHRGIARNDIYYAALGFLPRLEVDLRWTVIPGQLAFGDVVPDSRLIDSDRMLSARLALVPPRPGRPGLAIGIEDATGTRRFHSTYAVTGIPFSIQGLQTRASLGYAFDAFEASRHTLDGVFGAVELSPWRPVAFALEQDTEKWNTALGIDLGFGFRARVALLDLSHVGLGAGWAHAL